MLRLRPISLRDANEYVRKYHRHHKPVAGHKFSIGCEADGELVGVIIAGRPVSRYLDDGFTSVSYTHLTSVSMIRMEMLWNIFANNFDQLQFTELNTTTEYRKTDR